MNEFEKQLAGQRLKPIPPEWRAQILSEARAQDTRDVPASEAQPVSWLRELFWPRPQAWGALAAVWIVIAAFRFATPGPAPASGGAVAKGRVVSVPEQQRELAKILEAVCGKPEPAPTDRPRGARTVRLTFV